MMNRGNISVHDLKSRMDRGEDWHVLDVRSIYEYRHSHIDGSINMNVGALMANVNSIPRDKPIAVICATGGRSSLGCRLLMARGFNNVFNVQGGMSAWVLSGYPVA
jgi:hydroxyacylglutathione hydrolase